VLAIIIPTLQLIIIRRQALIQIKTEEGRKEGRRRRRRRRRKKKRG
jgi:hypothetical protein